MKTRIIKIFLIVFFWIIILYLFHLFLKKKDITESFYILSSAMENCPRPSCPKPDLPEKFKKMSKDDAKKYIENQISNQVVSTMNKALATYRETALETARMKTNPDENNEMNQTDHSNNINSFIIYKSSIYKIGNDKRIYQRFLSGGEWFVLTDNYNPNPFVRFNLRDFTILELNNRLYVYALFGTDLCKKDLSDSKSAWIKQRDVQSFSGVINITNNRDKLFFLVEPSNDGFIELEYLNEEEEEEEQNQGGNQIDKDALFSLSTSGIYFKSLTSPVMTVMNNPVGTFKDESNRAFRTYTGSANSIDQCSENCKSFRYFGLQDWNGKESACFCDNNLAFIQRYGETTCGKLGGPWCNAVYNRQVTDIQNYLLSDKYLLIRLNNYSKSTEFYGLYMHDSEIIVVKKTNIESSDAFDDKFEFSVEFVDLFVTIYFLYGLAKDGHVYRKSNQVNFFGEESKSWFKVTSQLVSTSTLKIDERKKLSVYNGFIYAIDNTSIRKHFIMGYEWVSIDNHDYVDQYYTTNPQTLINKINKSTSMNNYLEHDEESIIPTEELTIGINNKYVNIGE